MRILKSVPDLESVKSILINWAEINPRIIRIYLFGSYITKVKNPPGDIDVAIEISNKDNDIALGFWCHEGDRMERELSSLLNYKVDLEWFDETRTPTIKKGLEAGSIIIYESKDLL